jgi:hypothetical protein
MKNPGVSNYLNVQSLDEKPLKIQMNPIIPNVRWRTPEYLIIWMYNLPINKLEKSRWIQLSLMSDEESVVSNILSSW